MEGTLAILLIFGGPLAAYGIAKWAGLRRLQIERAADPEAQARIAQLESERAQLASRVDNLETIVCSVDYEINAQIEARHEAFKERAFSEGM